VIAKEKRALAALDDGEFARELRAALQRAEFAFGDVMSDPFRSGTMSPTATAAPASHRAVVEARSLLLAYCDATSV
jgi:hypothetical protein